MDKDGAFSHKMDKFTIFLEQSKSPMASKLLHSFKSYGMGGILPSGGVTSGRVCVCRLRSRLV